MQFLRTNLTVVNDLLQILQLKKLCILLYIVMQVFLQDKLLEVKLLSL